MEPLLLLSLFFAHLAVKGELLQYSTDVVYVSDDGIDDSSCLNGGSHCKTLGYVLTNIPMLQCSICAINVTYDHIVGQLNSSTLYTVNISNVEVLYIVGLGHPRLYFNGSGLLLVNNDNTTSVIIENVIFNDCYINDYSLDGCKCISTLGFLNNYINYYLLNFTVTNVVLYNADSICVVAQGVHWQHSNSYDSAIGGLEIVLPDVANSNIVVMNSTFPFASIALRHGHLHYLSNVSMLIRQCRFIGGPLALILLKNFTNFIVEECMFYCTGLPCIDIVVQGYQYIAGKILIINNNFTECTMFPCINISSTGCQNNAKILYTGNTFKDSVANNILYMENWAHFVIEDSIFINNTVYNNVAFINYIDVICSYYPDIIMKDLLFINNNVTGFHTADNGAIVTFQNEYIPSGSVKLSNLKFTSNIGTPLSLNWWGIISITGYMTFIGNNAITGGGMYISLYCTLHIADNATISFINNTASYGGAIYVDQDSCFVDSDKHNMFVLQGNHAISGQAIYSTYDWCSFSTHYDGCSELQNTTNIMSLPTNMSFNDDNTASIFPGQTIVGNVMITDCFGNASFCLADIYPQCEGICGSIDFDMHGSSVVAFSKGLINTGLKVIIHTKINHTFYIQLLLSCKSPIKHHLFGLTVNITVLPCPLGFFYSALSKQCECDDKVLSQFYICNRDIGHACIREGYWYSSYNHVVSQCIHLFCSYSRPKCPSGVSTDTTNYVLLSSSQDDQCFGGHGGTLCTGCAQNKLPTYGALQCIDSDKCAKWHPYVLLSFNIVIPFIYGVFLMIAIRLKLSIGSGYLYGPLFYLAILNLIPLSSYPTLNTIVSSFVATFLLKFEILGYIPWCFFDTVSLLTNKWFELIAPSVVAVVLLLTVYLARCSPKLIRHIQQSPLQAMCLLTFTLFWSLASTAISIITPVFVQVSQVKDTRVHLQPDLPYLSGGHIPLWMVSVTILLALYLIVIVLTFSRFLNFHRLKPVFDEFQSCYRDSYRWYSGVYFMVWTILFIMILTSSYQLFQTSVIALTVTHYLLQPYCKKWLNMMDGVLFGCLSATSSLVLDDTSSQEHSSSNTMTKVLVYMSVMGPLCLISLGVVSIVLVSFQRVNIIEIILEKFSSMKEKFQKFNKVNSAGSKPDATRSTINITPATNDSHYREPLLLQLQDSANYNATKND